MAIPRRSAPAPSAPSSGYAEATELERYKHVDGIGKGSFGVITRVKRVGDGKVSPHLVQIFESENSGKHFANAGLCIEAARLLENDREG